VRIEFKGKSAVSTVSDCEGHDCCGVVEAELVPDSVYKTIALPVKRDRVRTQRIRPCLTTDPVSFTRIDADSQSHGTRISPLPIPRTQIHTVGNRIIEADTGRQRAALVKLHANIPAPYFDLTIPFIKKVFEFRVFSPLFGLVEEKTQAKNRKKGNQESHF